jgi:hypothetical protein
MPTLPNKVTIGPLVYRITDDEVEHLREVTAEGDTWGTIKYGHGLIVLNPEQSDSHKRLSLLHECLHGCWHLTEFAHQEDEDPIRRITGPLLDVLRRNPDLVAYLLAEDA